MGVNELLLIIDLGCGLDVHKDTVVTSIKGKDIEAETCTYSIFTISLLELVGWLQNHDSERN